MSFGPKLKEIESWESFLPRRLGKIIGNPGLRSLNEVLERFNHAVCAEG